MFENRQKDQNQPASVLFQEFENQHLTDSLHVHPRFELVFVTQASGTLQIGAEILPFAPNSLILIPPDLLHCWQSNSETGISGITIHFAPETLPRNLLALPEMEALSDLISNASKGLSFHVQDAERLRTRLRSIHRARAALRLSRFYVALELVSTFQRTQLTTSQPLTTQRDAKSLARLEAAKRYITTHFQASITRSQAAVEVGMNEAAFSRFFHESTGTTFVDYVANLRVRHAATLLGNRRDLTVPDIAKASGFRTLSAFHRQFKKRLGTTPSAYRKAANSEPIAP